mmetsp:Transcript_32604/g.107538  ORF Transcript_32604/g.107538 Transcript_32604/m.107538 type:complete len:107 (-) Transcript_32604:392-712(-)
MRCAWMMERLYVVNMKIYEALMTQRGCESRSVLEWGRRAGARERARGDRGDDASGLRKETVRREPRRDVSRRRHVGSTGRPKRGARLAMHLSSEKLKKKKVRAARS